MNKRKQKAEETVWGVCVETTQARPVWLVRGGGQQRKKTKLKDKVGQEVKGVDHHSQELGVAGTEQGSPKCPT